MWNEIPADTSAFIDSLNEYLQNAVLAWTFGLLFTGEAPFTLPDMVIGARRSGYPGSTPGTTTIGSSDPIWNSGSAKVVWIADTMVDMNLAHELTHNLDTKTAGTWGRHVSNSCGTESTGDSQWPYTNDDIQEFGLLSRNITGLPRATTIGKSTPDFMSYCTNAPQTDPNNWISPYRWEALLTNFRVNSPAALNRIAALQGADIADAFYVSGRVRDDGTGVLHPIIAQPGPLQLPFTSGDYAIDLRACNDSTLASYSFSASFVDAELNPRETSPFSFVLPDPGGVCGIILRSGSNVLYSWQVSANSPMVEIVSPNGGETWSGQEPINWNWMDADGDELSASIFYSSDNGATWLPVASGLMTSSFEVDSTTLMGTEAARIRVVVSDGVNTTMDDSDEPFAVENKSPQVTISAPEPITSLKVIGAIEFRGSARETDGKRITGDSLRWYIDGELMGFGETTTAHLGVGTFTVRLEAVGETMTGDSTFELRVLSFDMIFANGFESAP